MSDLTKEELDDIFYQGGPLEEEWEESDYDEAIRRVHDESIAAATPHIRAALFDELISDAGKQNLALVRNPLIPQLSEWLKAHKENTQP